MKTLWVPVVWREYAEVRGYEPDIPVAVMNAYDMIFEIPSNLLDGKDFGKPSVQYARCTVPDEAAALITNAVTEDIVPEKDRLMAQLERLTRNTSNGTMAHTDADALFDDIPNIIAANPERKRDVKDILLQAVARGLGAENAENIRRRLDLPEARTYGS